MKQLRNRFSQPHRVVQETPGPDMAQQHFKEESDINTITSRYLRTGVLGNPGASRQPIFGDFSSIEFLDMQNAIADVDSAFMSLPARVRGRFDNSPYQLIRFVENPNNYDECVRLGLLPGKASPEVDPNQVKMPLDKSDSPAPKPGEPAKADPEANPTFPPKGGKPNTP